MVRSPQNCNHQCCYVCVCVHVDPEARPAELGFLKQTNRGPRRLALSVTLERIPGGEMPAVGGWLPQVLTSF